MVPARPQCRQFPYRIEDQRSPAFFLPLLRSKKWMIGEYHSLDSSTERGNCQPKRERERERKEAGLLLDLSQFELRPPMSFSTRGFPSFLLLKKEEQRRALSNDTNLRLKPLCLASKRNRGSASSRSRVDQTTLKPMLITYVRAEVRRQGSRVPVLFLVFLSLSLPLVSSPENYVVSFPPSYPTESLHFLSSLPPSPPVVSRQDQQVRSHLD